MSFSSDSPEVFFCGTVLQNSAWGSQRLLCCWLMMTCLFYNRPYYREKIIPI